MKEGVEGGGGGGGERRGERGVGERKPLIDNLIHVLDVQDVV